MRLVLEAHERATDAVADHELLTGQQTGEQDAHGTRDVAGSHGRLRSLAVAERGWEQDSVIPHRL